MKFKSNRNKDVIINGEIYHPGADGIINLPNNTKKNDIPEKLIPVKTAKPKAEGKKAGAKKAGNTESIKQ